MRGLCWLLLALLCIETIADAKDVRVRGYRRKDGTYVKAHRRSKPDGIFSNNWSTKGNVNPYTGKRGTLTRPSKGGSAGFSFPTASSSSGGSSSFTPSDSFKPNRRSASFRDGRRRNSNPLRRGRGSPKAEPLQQINAAIGGNDVFAELEAANGNIREPAEIEAPPKFKEPEPPMPAHRIASSRLELAKRFIAMKRPLTAREWLERLVAEYPQTDSAVEAEELLAGLPRWDRKPLLP